MSGLGIGEIINLTKDTLTPVGGTLSDIWQAVVGDRVAAWRLKNAMKTQKAIIEEARQSGLAINSAKVPERYAFAWFEEAMKQDEPEIQALFARLLLRAAQNDQDALDRRHISTLSQFTPIDAAVFKSLFQDDQNRRWGMGFAPQLPRWPHEHTVRQVVQLHGDSAANAVEHLLNLGVLARGFKIENVRRNRSLSSDLPYVTTNVKNEIIATGLGWSLHSALRDAP